MGDSLYAVADELVSVFGISSVLEYFKIVVYMHLRGGEADLADEMIRLLDYVRAKYCE